MKLGIISDTHGEHSLIDKAMKNLKDVDLIIHAGDHYKDAKYIEKKYNINVIGVAGNCDEEKIDEKLKVINGKRFFITHGHNHNVKTNISNLFYTGKEKDVDVIIFGHSHVPFYEVEEGIAIINPGSISIPRGGSQKSGCILTINENLDVKFFNI